MSHESELAYLAGFFDGEGSITANRSGGRMWYVVVSVWNTDPRPVQKFADLFGGQVVARAKQAEHHRQGYNWQSSNNATSRKVLSALLPYLVVKHMRAELALALASQPSIQGKHLDQEVEERATRDRLANAIRDLNQKGESLEPMLDCALV